MPAIATRAVATEPDVEAVIAETKPFTPVLFNSPIHRELSLYVPGTGVIVEPNGFRRMDVGQATYIQFRNGKRWATNEEELYWLRHKAAQAESHVYEADPGYSKTCRTCGRVWESQDARDDCTDLHPQN